VNPPDAERARLRRAWPGEFADGERCAYLHALAGGRDPWGYPCGFGAWPLERRNAWFAGFSFGLLERERDLMEPADE
jgi:hypothetical protein